jgi:hypothetical protein
LNSLAWLLGLKLDTDDHALVVSLNTMCSLRVHTYV